MTKSLVQTLGLAGMLALCGTSAFAQGDSGALLDALVRKKILTDQEAEDIRSELVRDNAATTAGKIRLSNSVSELKLYGDLRLRYQYDERKARILPPQNTTAGSTGSGNPQHGSQRSRERFRLRVGADFKLTENFFGGVQLQTSSAADSGNQTFSNGFGNYDIYISRAFLGWQPTEWLTLIGGKQANPFYTTDLVWDSDINPQGVVERIEFHKLFGGGTVTETTGYSKDGQPITSTVTALRRDVPWELTLNAGQFFFFDNNEDAVGSDYKSDVWLFTTQLVGRYKFNKNVSATFAPGWMVYNAGNLTGLNNETPFNNNGTTVLHGASRDLSVLTAPGDVSFKIGSVKTKVLWDFAYNINGAARAKDIYNMTGVGGVSSYETKDSIAWLAGFQLGDNKNKGDWSLFFNYRQTGLASVDPNLNDSDFALGQLNTQGFKTGVAYNVTDFCVLAATYYDAQRLRANLVGGEATNGNKIAQYNSVRILQLDVNVKF